MQDIGICACGQGVENPKHILGVCTLEKRRTAREDVEAIYGGLTIVLRRNNAVDPEQLRKTELLANRVMDEDDANCT